MAIERTETTAGAPPPSGGLTAQEKLSCSREEWRPSGRQGKKVVTTLLRRSGRGEAGLRPDQAIEEAVWSGLDTGSRRRHWRQAPAKTDRTGPHRRSVSAFQASRIVQPEPCHRKRPPDGVGDSPPIRPCPSRALDGTRTGPSDDPKLRTRASPAIRRDRQAGPRCFGHPTCLPSLQLRTRLPPASPGAAKPATRRKAVMPTATAPMMAKTTCQASDGIRSRVIPKAA